MCSHTELFQDGTVSLVSKKESNLVFILYIKRDTSKKYIIVQLRLE